MQGKNKRYRLLPELKEGIRIQYADIDGKLRSERIYSRTGNRITTINALKEKHRIRVEQVRGYWKPKIRAKPENITSLALKRF